MAKTTFLTNDVLWQTITSHVKAARHVDAAIAYIGDGGARLLPLRKGDRLVVDMTPRIVRAGATDPHEIEKLIRRGVLVFSRQSLHAKTVVTEKAAITGSMNVSNNSQQVLDEAGIMTTDLVAVRRAREFVDRLCIEPVRPEYLQKCKEIYRPPRMQVPTTSGKRQAKRTSHAKLWLVYLSESWIPEDELERYEEGETKAKEYLKDVSKWTTDSFWWSRKPKMADELELGDWIIRITKFKNQRIVVEAPCRFLLLDHYARRSDPLKRRWVFHLEVPVRTEKVPWNGFRLAAKCVLNASMLKAPRTRSIRNVQMADGLLAIWTPAGRFSKRNA